MTFLLYFPYIRWDSTTSRNSERVDHMRSEVNFCGKYTGKPQKVSCEKISEPPRKSAVTVQRTSTPDERDEAQVFEHPDKKISDSWEHLLSQRRSSREAGGERDSRLL